MSVDEARRLLLHDAARDAWGAEAVLVLMEMLPPTGWADVATKQDLAHLESRLGNRIDRIGNRIDRIDDRIDRVDDRVGGLAERMEQGFDALRWELRAEIAVGHRRFIQWNVATVIAAVTAMTAVVKLA